MLPVHIDEKLKLFRDKEYKILQTNEETDLQEKSREGSVMIRCRVCQESIILTNPEQNVLPYLDAHKKGARSCADVCIYTLDRNTGKWDLHVMEFKKVINTDSMGKSKWQFIMGICNARAIAAFLGMDLQNIILYSGYRTERISDLEEAALISIRANNNREAVKKINEWKRGICSLKIDDIQIKYPHKKIPLDRNGYGSLVI